MKTRSILLVSAAVVGCLLTPLPAGAFIGVPPQTLGSMCRMPDHIAVLKVDKVSPDKGVIIFKHVEQLKGKYDGGGIKHVIPSDAKGGKIIRDWVAEGKTAVVFYFWQGKGSGHVYIDGSWYQIGSQLAHASKTVPPDVCWFVAEGEPKMLSVYCGTVDKLRDAVKKILKGEEVVVPAMANDDRKALEEGRAKVQDIRAGLKIVGENEKPSVGDDKKPATKPQPDGTKPGEKTPDQVPTLIGTVKAIAADGKSLTLSVPAMEKNKEPTAVEIQITDRTKVVVNPGGKLVVGEVVSVWLEKGDAKTAVAIQIGKPTEKPGVKPEPGTKPGEKIPALVGTVKAVAANGKSFTLLLPPTEKNKEGAAIEIQLTERTKITDGKEIIKLAVGQAVSVSLEKGDMKIAVGIQIGKPGEKPPVKPVPGEKPGKPGLDEKPEAPRKPKVPAGPVRDPAPTATVIDTEIDKQLAELKISASPAAEDAEFIRRVTLDLTGRIPTYQQTVAFLDSKDPDKRRKLIDDLLDSPAYGDHFAAVWRNQLIPRELNVNGKGGGQRDTFSPWLAEQFNDNRSWNAIVVDLLTAEGSPADNPATAFLMANGMNSQPQPAKVAGAVSGLFWGVNLRCAECHNHPFMHWKQADFWGTAAFFGKLQYGGKGGPQALTESRTVTGAGKEKGQPTVAVSGSAIVIPSASGKAAGQVVKARFLGADEPNLDEKEPFRPRFAAWATSADNPYFAKAAANRMWAHFFGRGLVNPLDGLDASNPASHPELLDKLAKEFTASGFDLQHLARCITTSKAYQRSSRPAPGNKPDPAAFSHMAVKVLTPEVLCDALAIATRGTPERPEVREQFARAFRSDEDAAPTDYIQGIPQLLRLMNGPLLNGNAPVVDRLVSSRASHAEAVTTLYLTVLSRRPSDDEVELMENYLAKRKDDREGYRGVLWILLNTSEFALNH